MIYRWEFLRRNKQYINDWHELRKRADKGEQLPRRGPELEGFCRKWKMKNPLPPDWTFDMAIPRDEAFQEQWPGILLSLVFGVFENEMAIRITDIGYRTEDLDPSKEPENVVDGKPTIEIDFSYSDNKILEEFKYFLEMYRGYRELIPNRTKSGKHHYDNFDTYLQVYDLREKGMSWSEIVKALGLFNKDTARNHYKSACKLIEEGGIK